MTKFADDLKRIIGIDRDQASTPAGKEIGGIPSVRGIGTQNGGSATSSTSVSGAGPEVEQTDTGSTSGRTDNTTSSDTGNSNAPNPNNANSFIKSADSGKFTAKDIIDGTDGPSMKTADLATFQGVGFEGGSLSGITAEDCASGNALDIRTDGLLVPPSATTYDDGSIKTAAWTDANTPPELVGFQSGFYWDRTTSGASGGYYSTPILAADGMKAYLDANPAGSDVPPYTITGVNQSSPSVWVVGFEVDDGGGGTRTFTLATSRGTCPAPDADPAACPATAPTEAAWPEDSTISLTYSGGRFVGSQYDPEITPTYSGQTSSSIAFCFDTSRHGIIRAAREGGTVIYETTGLNGAPTGLVRYYDSSGAFAGASDTTGLQMFLAPGDT